MFDAVAPAVPQPTVTFADGIAPPLENVELVTVSAGMPAGMIGVARGVGYAAPSDAITIPARTARRRFMLHPPFVVGYSLRERLMQPFREPRPHGSSSFAVGDSIGRSEGEPSREIITELIEAATWAPNHHLTEPWKFTVLSGDARRELGEFWAKTRADELALEGEKRDGFMQGEAKKPLRAPVLIIVSARTDARCSRRRRRLCRDCCCGAKSAARRSGAQSRARCGARATCAQHRGQASSRLRRER